MSFKAINDFFTTFLESHGDEDIQNEWKEQQAAFKKLFKKKVDKVEKKEKKQGPKGAKNAYIFFCQEHRATLKEEQPDLKGKEVLSELGKIWNDIKEKNPELLKKYQDMASEDKERYADEKENFVPETEEVPKKKKSGAKKKKDSNAPKRFKNAYMFFCADERAVVKEEMPELKGKEILVEIGLRWKKLKEDNSKKLKKYEKMASKDRERYDEEMKDYQPSSEEESEKEEGEKEKPKRGRPKKTDGKKVQAKKQKNESCNNMNV
jgi:structure-specific recognition protein 1